MIIVLNLIAAVLVWATVFLFANSSWGVTSESLTPTTIVALGVTIIYLIINNLRLKFKSNAILLVIATLATIPTLFTIDYFLPSFTITSVGLGVALGIVIAIIFLGAAFTRKAILGDRGQL